MFMSWYVLKTRPNLEIKIAESLNSIGINAYCPAFCFIKQYSDRKKKVNKPLLPSYVLVKIEESLRVKVFSVPGVLSYLFSMGRPAVVREDEVEILKSELNNIYNISNSDKLNTGDNITIQKDLKGFRRNNLTNNKLRLKLKSIGLYMTLNLG